MAIDAAVLSQIRLLIPDTEKIYGPGNDENIFTDEDIESFYFIGKSNVLRAAGWAKITVGSSEALILKVITNYETKTDGASLMKQWVAAGQAMLARGDKEDDTDLDALDYFDIIEHNPHPEVLPEGTVQGWPGGLGW